MIEIGFPERIIVLNENQFKRFIVEYNGKKNIYRSVYSFKKLIKGKPEHFKINQIYFDFDENTHEVVKEFCKKLKNDNIKFRVNFSGNRGFHIYIACEDKDIDKKSYLISLHKYIIEKYNLINFDPHIIGNIRQMRRIENTINISSGLYCIPLTYNEIFYTFNEIKKLAEHPKSYKYWIKGELFILQDKYNIVINENHIITENGNGEFSEIPKLPEPCILAILIDKHPMHEARFLLCLWLSFHFRNGKDINDFDLNKLSEKIIFYMKNLYWDDYSESPNTSKSTRYQVLNIIEKKYNFVPNCTWRKLYGLCQNCGKNDE